MAAAAGETGMSVVILAAGLGSRFGGDKQLAEVGPSGEAFLDYTIKGCQQAGITNIVLVVRGDLQAEVAEHVAQFHEGAEGFSYVRQDEFGPPRAKPWGTAHAVLAAREAVPGAFIVANADDYYAPEAFKMLREILDLQLDEQGGLLGFELEGTVPDRGQVSRGLCEVRDGYLVDIVETPGIHRIPEGIVSGAGELLDPETLVSLNFWGFPAGFMAVLGDFWDGFCAQHGVGDGAGTGDASEVECFLPDAVAAAIADLQYEFRVRPCDLKWVGVTNQDDLDAARQIFSQGLADS